MNYYPFHIGDYIAHTAHLDPIEDCAYRRLLDAYYLNEGPLPADVAMCARQVRMKANLAEVEQVLKEFFELTERGWMHARCEAEIAHMNERSAKARASAEASVNARRAKSGNGASTKSAKRSSESQANAERTLNERSTNVELPNTQDPITNTQTPPNPPAGGSLGDAVERIEVEEVVEIAPEDRQPTPQGAVCMAMKSVGIPDVNPSHTGLKALLDAGVALETFVATARESVARGKPSFRYVLGVVERQEREARDLAKALEKERIDSMAETHSQRAARLRMEEISPMFARKAPGQMSAFAQAQAFMNGASVVNDEAAPIALIGG